MLTGTKVKIEILAPTLDNKITRPVTSTVSNHKVEFDDVNFFDLQGDPYNVVHGQFDITGSRVSYRTLESGMFLDVNDQTGFNGSAITFKSLNSSSGVTLRNADIDEAGTTLGVEASDVFTDKNTLFMNVDGLSFVTGDTVLMQLGFNVKGDAGNDKLAGMGGRDRVVGLAGNDQLAGNGGNDLLIGGLGADKLTGGGGADVFQFNLAAESVKKASGPDTITDFSHAQGDRIDFSHIPLGLARAVDESFTFIGSDPFSGEGTAELRVGHRSGGVYVVSGDVDGDGKSDVVVHVTSSTPLEAADFML
jgi:Ca2+-binding RTX toxin-like protein